MYSNTVREFRVNDFITLKLQGNRTHIYVKNQPFMQCMYLLLNVDLNRTEDYDEIESIDEAAVRLNRRMERNHNIISPTEEFMGHCSNIQAWAENEYDTRLLHRNLAFPLLKKLTDVGDPIARKKFKEEIAIRFASGHRTVQVFLRQQGYLRYLTEEEFESILEEIDFPIIDEIVNIIDPLIHKITEIDSRNTINHSINRILREFRLNYRYLILIPLLKRFSSRSRQKLVEFLYNKYKRSKRFPMLKFIEKTLSHFNDIELNHVKDNNRLIGILIDENKLDLKNKDIRSILNLTGIEKFVNNIEVLDLSNNKISEMKGFEKFTNLRILTLRNNLISDIINIENLVKLEVLDLSYNANISEIPDFLKDMPSLKTLKLTGCKIKSFSDSVTNFFWMGQNYRYYSNYSAEEVEYYERTHSGKATGKNKPYKRFIEWLFKLRVFMKELKFSFKDITVFENKTEKFAIQSGKPTKTFKKWLLDRCQTKITSFIEIEHKKEGDLGSTDKTNNINENQMKKIISALFILITVSYGLSLAASGVSIPGCGEISPR